MTAMRDTCCGTFVIAVVVAAGFWFADSADVATGHLSASGLKFNSSQDELISVRRIGWLPSGDRLLTLTSAGTDRRGPLVLHDVAHADQQRYFDLERDSVSSLSIAPDGRHALIGTFNGHLWWIGLDSDERTDLIELPPRSSISVAAISTSGKWVVAGINDGQILMCPTPASTTSSVATNELGNLGPDRWTASNYVILTNDLTTSSCELRFSKSDDRLLWAGSDGSLRLWDLQTGNLLQAFPGDLKIVTAAVFLPGEDRIMSADVSGAIRIREVQTGQEVWRGQFGSLGVNALTLSPDGETVAWGGYDRKIRIWSIEQARMKFEIETPAPIIWDLRFSPDGKTLAAAGRERTVRIYDAQTGVQRHGIERGIL